MIEDIIIKAVGNAVIDYNYMEIRDSIAERWLESRPLDPNKIDFRMNGFIFEMKCLVALYNRGIKVIRYSIRTRINGRPLEIDGIAKEGKETLLIEMKRRYFGDLNKKALKKLLMFYTSLEKSIQNIRKYARYSGIRDYKIVLMINKELYDFLILLLRKKRNGKEIVNKYFYHYKKKKRMKIVQKIFGWKEEFRRLGIYKIMVVDEEKMEIIKEVYIKRK